MGEFCLGARRLLGFGSTAARHGKDCAYRPLVDEQRDVLSTSPNFPFMAMALPEVRSEMTEKPRRLLISRCRCRRYGPPCADPTHGFPHAQTSFPAPAGWSDLATHPGIEKLKHSSLLSFQGLQPRGSARALWHTAHGTLLDSFHWIHRRRSTVRPKSETPSRRDISASSKPCAATGQ